MTEVRVLGTLKWTNYNGAVHTAKILNGLWSFDRMYGNAGVKLYMELYPVALEENVARLEPNLDGIAFESCMMSKIPPQVFAVKTLTRLWIQNSFVSEIPIEVCGLINLIELKFEHCGLGTVPAKVGMMPNLSSLNVTRNILTWLPSVVARSAIHDGCNLRVAPLDTIAGVIENTVDQLRVFAFEFTEAAIGLQDLELPALVTIEILDALAPNAVRMAAKWDLIVAVKHFRR